jgi:shikimate dehydrogenase
MVRAALQALELPGEVYKLRLSDPVDLAKIVRSVRAGKLSAACFSGTWCDETVRMADEVEESARRADCADVLLNGPRGVVAHNIAYGAFVDLFEGVKQRGTVAIIGSGPSACAAVAACRDLGFPVIGVTSRSFKSTEVLCESSAAERMRRLGALPTLWPASGSGSGISHFSREMRLQFAELAASACLLVQTVAMDPSAPDAPLLARLVPWPKTRRDAFVCDLVYGAIPSPFLVESRGQDLAGVGGIEMLTRRGLQLIETWTGRLPPRACLHAAVSRMCMRPDHE